MSGDADYLRLGDWNFRCDRCQRKMKGTQGLKTWDNLYVCERCWEPRQPQDFVRSIVEHPTPPFVRNPADVFIATGAAIVQETDDSSDTPFDDPEYILLEIGILYFLTEN